MSSSPAIYDATPKAIELTSEDLETLRATVFRGANDAQLRLYARNCQSRGLDPFAKEIYAWAGRDGAVEIVVSIDGLRNLAENSGEYQGQQGPFYCGDDGEWTEVWLQKSAPLAAKVTVLRVGREPMTNVALLSEFKRDTPTWGRMPTVMLAKAAEAQAIRRQFPRQTAGLFIREELEREPAAGAVVEARARGASASERGDPAPSESTASRTAGAEDAFDPNEDHGESWREFVMLRKAELAVSDPEFNRLRRELKLPLVRSMSVAECRALSEAMLNLASGGPASGESEDAGGHEAAPLDAAFAVSGVASTGR